MKIMPLNTQQNQQPSFNGYVDKKILKIVKKATKAEINKIYSSAKKFGYPISQEQVNKTLNTSSSILERLNGYMSQFKKDTYLTLGSFPYKDSFVLKNKRLKNTTHQCSNVFDTYLRKNDNNSAPLDYKHRSNSILSAILKFTEELEPEMAERIEKSMFINFAKTQVRFPLLRAQKADKLAQEFKAEDGWVEKLQNYRKSKKFKKIKNKIELKEIERKNKEIYKEALKKSGY